ncbi:MAG TPA: hypothetical protein VMT53_14580 [Terriglobales bacterium]|nr:hypothetical protein [Terriglobales bacterium]
MDDPQYVLSFTPVQRLMLLAVQRPLTDADIQTGLQSTPVSLSNLLSLNLLRQDGRAYRLNYLLLTVRDQKMMYAASERFGESLATAFEGRRAEFHRILKNYTNPTLRSQLLFDLVAGVALNWGGLDLTTELGYRITPPHHANADVYFVHSEEVGANLDFRGLYLDSETATGSTISFSTFGDGGSRLEGLPDAFDGVEMATEDWRSLPQVYGALRSEYITYILIALDDAGRLMNAVAHGVDTEAALTEKLSIPQERRAAAIRLLTAIGYLKQSDSRYSAGVPVLTENDKPMVDEALQLSRKIMADWLEENYPVMREQLADLSPMRNGVPFSLMFSEAWHYTFGFATKRLAETGFYANPHEHGSRYDGYAPLVWANSVLKGPTR